MFVSPRVGEAFVYLAGRIDAALTGRAVLSNDVAEDFRFPGPAVVWLVLARESSLSEYLPPPRGGVNGNASGFTRTLKCSPISSSCS